MFEVPVTSYRKTNTKTLLKQIVEHFFENADDFIFPASAHNHAVAVNHSLASPAGDCQVVVCDGSGGIKINPDNLDLPVDGND